MVDATAATIVTSVTSVTSVTTVVHLLKCMAGTKGVTVCGSSHLHYFDMRDSTFVTYREPRIREILDAALRLPGGFGMYVRTFDDPWWTSSTCHAFHVSKERGIVLTGIEKTPERPPEKHPESTRRLTISTKRRAIRI